MKVYFNDPSLPDGYGVGLTGLSALLINGKETEIDADTVRAYEATTGKKLADVVKGKKFTKKSAEREGS